MFEDGCDLFKEIPKDKLKYLFQHSDASAELDHTFLGFEHIYQEAANAVPKDFTIIDLGCAYATQSWIFRDYEKYIGVDIGGDSDSVLHTDNSVFYFMSIQEFLDKVLPGLNLNMEKTFAICSYVPDKEAQSLACTTFQYSLVYYPGMISEKKFPSLLCEESNISEVFSDDERRMCDMKNYLTDKLLLIPQHGSNCTLEVCTTGEPDADQVIFCGTVSDCLRKTMTHELAMSGDEYFCLYTNQGSYDGINFDEVACRMGYVPDELRDILVANPTYSAPADDKSKSENAPEIKILSLEECSDADYGNTLVQYQAGDVISFAFSKVFEKEALEQPQLIAAEIQKMLSKDKSQKPSWSVLSESLEEALFANPFDMHFIEYDDDKWTEEMADALWDEVCELNLNGSITCGEDGCLVTVYAGAMSDINWMGHSYYGVPCFEHVLEADIAWDRDMPSLDAQIASATSQVTTPSHKECFSNRDLDL